MKVLWGPFEVTMIDVQDGEAIVLDEDGNEMAIPLAEVTF